MIYGSVCSGIEAASVAWEPLGWRASFLSEIEAFPRAVLAHRFSEVPLHGDFTTIGVGDYEPVELLVGGTPCQDFSVAGLRAGLAGARGNLTLEFLALAGRLRPRWLVWENVPGVLSIDGGRAFGALLGGLGQLGYGFAYRVLDAQYFGVPQRRRRVFVVGYLGDWRPAAAVLLERASLRGDSPPCREAGERIAGAITSRLDRGGVNSEGGDNHLVASAVTASDGHHGRRSPRGDGSDNLVARPLASSRARGSGYRNDDDTAENLICGTLETTSHDWTRNEPGEALVAHTLTGNGFDASADGTGRGTPLVAHAFDARQSGVLQYGDRTGPLDTDAFTMAVAFHQNQRAEVTTKDVTGSLNGGGGKPGQGYPAIQQASAVRRLLPAECEKLQGFQPGWTAIAYRGKPAADGPRYRAIGNSMAVPVMRWLGERIEAVEKIRLAALSAA